MTMLQHAILMLLLPLASAVVIALFLRKQGALAAYLSTATAGAIAVIAIILLQHGERFEASVEWLRFGDFALSLGIKFDDLAALMMFVVGFVVVVPPLPLMSLLSPFLLFAPFLLFSLRWGPQSSSTLPS